MHERVCPSRRMRCSYESRCRLVSMIVEGMSPQAAAAACGASVSQFVVAGEQLVLLRPVGATGTVDSTRIGQSGARDLAPGEPTHALSVRDLVDKEVAF